MSVTFWIVAGILLLLILGGSKGNGAPKTSREDPSRIDRPHYYDPDDHECPVCGARFRENSMVCPRCGARFKGTKTDEEEYIEEMDFWEDDEEES